MHRRLHCPFSITPVRVTRYGHACQVRHMTLIAPIDTGAWQGECNRSMYKGAGSTWEWVGKPHFCDAVQVGVDSSWPTSICLFRTLFPMKFQGFALLTRILT